MIQQDGYGDLLGDLAAQTEAAQNRHIQPADPVEFIKWVVESTREHSEALEKLKHRYQRLSQAEDLATIGLKRVESLILLDQRPALQTLQDMHRDFTRANGGIAYTLEQTQGVIRELITNYQMVAESLRSPIADRFKKIGIQKDLGLRLRDLDDSMKRSASAVGQQEKINKQLSEGIQVLLSKTAVKLPPAAKESIAREDEVRRIALKLGKKIESGVDPVNYTRQPKENPIEIAVPIEEARRDAAHRHGHRYGHKQRVRRDDPNGVSDNSLAQDTTSDSSISFAGGAAALVIGAILGVLLIHGSKL